MTLNAVSGALQVPYSMPYCRLSLKSKENARTFGRHLPRSCARRQEQTLRASGMTHFYSACP